MRRSGVSRIPIVELLVKITYVCLQPRGGGGASDTHVNGLLRALAKAGHEVELVEVEATEGSLWQRLLRGLSAQLRGFRRLRDADVVWLRMHPLGVVTTLLAGRRLCVEVNGVTEDYYVAHPGLRRWDKLLQKALSFQLRRARLVLPVTPGLGAWAAAQTAARVFVLPNAVDVEQFSEVSTRQPRRERYALFFGSLTPWQGIDLALAAAEHPCWPTGVRLIVAGDGRERSKVVGAAAAGGNVQYLGHLTRDALNQLLREALVSLVPKRYHDPRAGQSPLKLYESLAAGVPVIATRLKGATDIPNLNDVVIPIDPDPGQLAAAVAKLAADPDTSRSLGAEGRRRVLASHTWDHRVAACEPLLVALMQ